MKEEGSRNEALFSPPCLPFSLTRSFAVRYSSWQPQICFPPPFRPRSSGGSTIASSKSKSPPSLLSKNDYGIEMKIRSGIHSSLFLFGPRFCTITFAFSLEFTTSVIYCEFQYRAPYPHLSRDYVGKIELFCTNTALVKMAIFPAWSFYAPFLNHMDSFDGSSAKSGVAFQHDVLRVRQLVRDGQ